MTWIAAASLIFGAGVWATHFLAMLAYKSSFPITYALSWTGLSILVAIAFSAAGFCLYFLRGQVVGGGMLVGAGISAMHYVGMWGLRGYFHVSWDYRYVLASILLAGIFAMAAITTFDKIKGIKGMLAAAALFSAGTWLAHFTGMSAATLVPDPGAVSSGTAIPSGDMAIVISAVIFLIVALGQIGAQFDRMMVLARIAEAERQKMYISELEATRTALNHALHEAGTANAAKTAFLASMSHELRTPLNAVIGFTELMKSSLFGPLGHAKYEEYVCDINKSGVHLLSLINDILDLSRLEAGKTDLVEEKVLLRPLIAEVCRSVMPLVRDGGLHLEMDIPAHLPGLIADGRRVRQIVLNLVSNAVKFTPAGGQVNVRTFVSGGELVVEVGDTGIGISDTDMPKALERFGQVENCFSRKHQGSGLGLPLVRQLAELHGGRFDISSQPGAGTTATVTFPAARVVGPAGRTAQILPIRAGLMRPMETAH